MGGRIDLSPKIIDVARHANVSTATVSRVINKTGNVSTEVCERVTRAIEEIGYQPSKVASYLASRKTTFDVGIIAGKRVLRSIENNSDEFYTVIYEGIKDFSGANNMKLELYSSSNEIPDCDGYILIGGEITGETIKKIKNEKKPLVLVDQYLPGLKVDCVITDGYDGAVYAVNYLLKKGMKKVVHIHGPLNHFGFKDRYDGYANTMERYGYMPKVYEYNEINDNMSDLVDLMLRNYGLPEGIFCANDTAARRVIEELQKRDHSIPEEISVIGFDDIMSATAMNPSLTTLKVFKYEMGRTSARRLFNLLIGHEPHPIKISLFTEFIRRNSTI